MILHRVRIEGFGFLRDFDLHLDEGMTVVTGPNEAGKSTLASFIPAVIFGFPDARSSLNQYPSLAGGRRGGWLEFTTGGHEYRAERWQDPGGRVSGDLSLFRDGERLPNQGAQDLLESLWGGLSSVGHRNLLNFGISELEDVRSMQSTDVAQLLYATAAGIDISTLERIEGVFNERKSRLYRPRSGSEITDVLAELEDLEAEERRSAPIILEHNRMRSELVRRQAQYETLTATIAKRNHRLARLRATARIAPLQRHLASIQRDLAALDVPEGFPAGALARLRDREDTLEELEEESDTIRGQISSLCSRASAIREGIATHSLVEHETDLRKLIPEARSLSDILARRDTLVANLGSLGSECRDIIDELGPGWTVERGRNLAPSIPLRNRLDDMVSAAEESGRKMRDVESRASELRNGLVRFAGRTPTNEDPDPTSTNIDEMQWRVRRLDEYFDALSERERLATRLEYLERTGFSPTTIHPALVWLTPGVVLTMLLASVYLFLGDQPVPGMIAAAGSVLGISIFRLLLPMRGTPENTPGDPAESSRRMDALESSLRDSTRELFGDSRTRTAEEILRERRYCEQAAARAEASRSEIMQRKQVSDALAAAECEIEEIKRERDRIHEDFRAELEGLGFPAGTSPRDAARCLDPLHRLSGKLGQVQKLRTELEDLQRRIRRFEAEASRIPGIPSGREFSVREIRDAVLATAASLEELQREREELDGVDRRLGDLKETRDAIDARRRIASDRLDGLLVSGGCEDVEGFRERAYRWEEASNLRATADELTARIREIRGAFEDDLPDAPPEEGEVEREERALGEDEAELHRVLEIIGGLRSQLEAMGTSQDSAQDDLRRETALSRLRFLVDELRELEAASYLLQNARSRGEDERAPAAMLRASAMIRELTGHSYTGIRVAPDGGPPRLLTGDSRNVVKVSELSRGTLGGVYLALRMATLAEMAASHTPLPVVMDDPLVNLDDRRLKGAIELVLGAAEDFQVLYLTCHARIVDLFPENRGFGVVKMGAGNTLESNTERKCNR